MKWGIDTCNTGCKFKNLVVTLCCIALTCGHICHHVFNNRLGKNHGRLSLKNLKCRPFNEYFARGR